MFRKIKEDILAFWRRWTWRNQISQDLLEEINKAIHLSTDRYKLEEYRYIPIFVYDEFMGNRLHNSMLGNDAIFHGTVHTDERYSLYVHKSDGGNNPVLLKGSLQDCDTCKRVQGELWLIRPQQLYFIDKMKQNEVHFETKWTEVTLSFRAKKTPWLPRAKKIWAITYVGKPEYWQDKLDNWSPSSGYDISLCRSYEHKGPIKGAYYFYSKLE